MEKALESSQKNDILFVREQFKWSWIFKIRNQEYANVKKLQVFAHQISSSLQYCYYLVLWYKNMLAENEIRTFVKGNEASSIENSNVQEKKQTETF